MSDDECDYMSDDFLAKLTQVGKYLFGTPAIFSILPE